jgi:type III pantothenate kinase
MSHLCIDLGNTCLVYALINGEEISAKGSRLSEKIKSPEALRDFLTEISLLSSVEKIGISSVVPNLNLLLTQVCEEIFNISPIFLDCRTFKDFEVCTEIPEQVGTDMIAAAYAATKYYPDKDIIMIDMGTATTLSAISKDKKYLATVILPGLELSKKALFLHTAQLPEIDLMKPKCAAGRDTENSILAGLYYGQVGALKELSQRLITELFPGEPPHLIGTGGSLTLFADENIVEKMYPDLVIEGINCMLLNSEEQSP